MRTPLVYAGWGWRMIQSSVGSYELEVTFEKLTYYVNLHIYLNLRIYGLTCTCMLVSYACAWINVGFSARYRIER